MSRGPRTRLRACPGLAQCNSCEGQRVVCELQSLRSCLNPPFTPVSSDAWLGERYLPGLGYGSHEHRETHGTLASSGPFPSCTLQPARTCPQHDDPVVECTYRQRRSYRYTVNRKP